VTLLVRPEALQADPPAGAVNRLVGRTTRERFLGPTSRWDFTVPGVAPGRQTVLLCEGPVVAREAVALDPQRLLLLEAVVCCVYGPNPFEVLLLILREGPAPTCY
jgi:putative spermidine/putrescine transport system ATP-binding protein